MKKRLKFIWGTSNVIPGKWRLGLYSAYARGGAINTRGLAINLYGVIAWGVLVCAAGYLAGATALHRWMQTRPHNLVTWTDCALYPVRRDAIRVKRGQAFIQEGFDDLKAGNLRSALQKLSIGIDRYPSELKGRLTLAAYYDQLSARSRAIDILRGGFPYAGTNTEYLETVAAAASQGENYDLWIEACDTALAGTENRPDLAALRRWAQLQKVSALTQNERANDAIRLAEDCGAATDAAFAELKAHALLRRNTPLDAISFIESVFPTLGRQPTLLGLLGRAYREAGHRADMEKTFEELRVQRPTDPQVYMAIIMNRALIGDSAGVQEALSDFLLRFNSDSATLQKLAESLVLSGRSALSRAILDEVRRQGHAPLKFQQFLVETHITAGEWAAAREVLRTILPTAEPNDPTFAFWHLLRTQLIDATLDPSEGVQATLVTTIRGRQLTLGSYRRTIGALQLAGRGATARSISQFALGVYPSSPWLQATSAQLNRDARVAEAAKPDLLPLTTPVETDSTAATASADAATRAAQDSVADESVFMQKLDAAVREGRSADVIAALRDVRKYRPAWLTPREPEIALAELRTYGRLDETVNLQKLARLYLGVGPTRYPAIIDLATELHAQNHQESAIALLQEIKRRSPNHRPTLQLLEKWDPPVVAPRS